MITELERLQYEEAKVAAARADIAEGRVLSHEEVFQQLAAEFPDDADED